MRQFSLKQFSKITSLLIIPALFLTSFSNNSFKVQAGGEQKLNLLVQNKTSTDGQTWQDSTPSNDGKYYDWSCLSLRFNLPITPNYSPEYNGISDYNDSLSKKSNINNSDQRDCQNYIQKSQGQPVFAYQYRFSYKFDNAKKVEESKRFQPNTFENSTYDGIVYTFTYYNYWNAAKNSWNGWENPNKSGELGGWLVYPMKSEMGMPSATSLPMLNISSGNNSENTNTFTNETFEVMGAGQMRYKKDLSGGTELKRQKDGQIYVLMGSMVDMNEFNDGKKGNIILSGEYENIDFKDFGGGSGNAKFIITKAKRTNTSNSQAQSKGETRNIADINLKMLATGPNGDFVMVDKAEKNFYEFPKNAEEKFVKAKGGIVLGQDNFVVSGKADFVGYQDGDITNWKISKLEKATFDNNSSVNNQTKIETKILTFISQFGSGELKFVDEKNISYYVVNIDQSAPVKPPIGGWLDITKTNIKYKVTGKFEANPYSQINDIYTVEATKVEKN